MEARPPLSGLTAAEAARRLASEGSNALPEGKSTSLLRRLGRQLKSPLIYILLFGVVFDLGTWAWEGLHGWPIEGLVILAVLIFNAVLGVVQENRSEQALARLKGLAAPQSWVLRDGEWAHRPSAELVPGDLVRLEAGERVPADGVVEDAQGLLLDEAVLTGESVAVDRGVGAEVLSGTLAVRGKASVRVARTGPRSSMGRLAAMVGGMEMEPTPLEKRLDAFGGRIARWMLGVAAAMVAAGLAVEGVSQLDEILLFAVALAVAAVPEGLPAVVTMTLALGVQRMAKRKAVVRRLQAVEALGSVTVIATDKTGTLTENRMVVRALDATDGPDALRALVLANDAEEGSAAGDPLELGLLAHAREQGLDPAQVRSAHARVSVKPFDAAWRFMRVTVEHEGRRQSWLKGATEVLLERSTLSAEERARWTAKVEARAGEGYRVLGLATADGETEEALRFLGLVSLWDPPRREVPAAIAEAQAAGVRVLMMTGDHPATAQAVASSLGLRDAEKGAVTGAELDALGPAGLPRLVQERSVFARVSPAHKLAIVEALKASGQVVAVTGDGVNDAPALKRSDVGVAMGQRGSDVTREVADLVLLDDNFATIVAAIEEGRGIYANIQAFIRFLFSTNAAELALILGGTLFAWGMGLRDSTGALLLPLTAVQLLWVNFITDGPPAMAMGVDRHANMMARPPRPPASPLLDRPSVRFIAVSGVMKAALAGLALVLLPRFGLSLEATRTAVFLYTTLAQLAFVYPARHVEGRSLTNWSLHAAVFLAMVLQLATVLVPAFRTLLGLVPLDAQVFAVVAGGTVVTWLLAELIGRWSRAGAQPAPVMSRVPRP